jgi:hypothetical protein
VAAAAAITCRTIPAAILVKSYAVEDWNWWCDRLAEGAIDEDTNGEILLERVRRRDGMATTWESIEITPTGRRDGYLSEVVVVRSGEVWWIPDDYVMRVQQHV